MSVDQTQANIDVWLSTVSESQHLLGRLLKYGVSTSTFKYIWSYSIKKKTLNLNFIIEFLYLRINNQ